MIDWEYIEKRTLANLWEQLPHKGGEEESLVEHWWELAYQLYAEFRGWA